MSHFAATSASAIARQSRSSVGTPGRIREGYRPSSEALGVAGELVGISAKGQEKC
jgi:hypothetical protein